MKISVLDVGSNSVRLATVADGKTLYKAINTTRLSEGLAISGVLKAEAIERTALAIKGFVERAKAEQADRIYVFATAAVRSASNRGDFLKRVKELCGIEVDVVSGKEEARLGILGALGGRDGGIIDVGGASTEVTVQRGGQVLYSYSADIGTVRLHDLGGRDIEKLKKISLERIADYGDFDASAFDMYAIGGTPTTIASVKHGLKVYDPEIVDGTVFSTDEFMQMAERFLSMPVEKVRKISGMEPNRADVIGGGCLLTALVLQHFKISKVTVSESDNLEGYIMLKEGLK